MEGEVYHIFNRGAHKQPIFLDDADRRRFQIMLYLGNNTGSIDVGNVLAKYQGPSLARIFELGLADQRLVDVLAYSLMPNHFHLVVRQKVMNGITMFMRKLCTGHSMYFNLKHDHSGTLFQGRFKSSHINSDPYFNWIFAYVHLNPISLTYPGWEEKNIDNPERAWNHLTRFYFSSFYDFYSSERPERSILAYDEARAYVDSSDDIEALIRDYSRGRVLFPAE